MSRWRRPFGPWVAAPRRWLLWRALVRRAAMRKVAAGLCLLGLGLLPVAVETASAAPLRRVGQNPRGLALGGTGLSYANDEMAFFYNPAGLADISNFWFELLPISLEVSQDAVDLVSGGEFGDFGSPTSFIRARIGEELQFRGFIYPHAVTRILPGVTIGATYFAEAQTELTLRNQATPEADAFYRLDQGTIAGVGFTTLEGAILWGINMRNLQRTTGEGTISSADLAISSARGELDVEALLDTGSGSGVGYDVGMIWRMESFSALRAQFALVVQNVGGLGLGDAGEVPQEIGLGWSFRPRFFPLVPILFAVEFRDVTYALSDDTSTAKRTHMGLEVGVLPLDGATNLLTFRAGVSGDAYSFGFEFSAWHSFTIQYVLYTQEYGETQGSDPRGRQLLQFQLLGF